MKWTKHSANYWTRIEDGMLLEYWTVLNKYKYNGKVGDGNGRYVSNPNSKRKTKK